MLETNQHGDQRFSLMLTTSTNGLSKISKDYTEKLLLGSCELCRAGVKELSGRLHGPP